MTARRPWRAVRTALLAGWSAAVLLYLFLPIAVVVAFSFNDTRGRFNLTWSGFTLEHWSHPLAVEGLTDALVNSLVLASLSTVLALALGTLIAIALVRHRFAGRRAMSLLALLPIGTPEIVLGAALLGFFLTVNMATGFLTILLAHTLFGLTYVVITVAARLEGLNPQLDEAAMDLGANTWAAMRTVTLPLLAPALAAAGLLVFVLSLDDFVITNFTSGATPTFPLFIFGAARQGVPPQVNVLATLVLLAALALLLLNLARQRRAVSGGASARW